MADGYRIMLAYPDTNYFVNLKVEMSKAGMFPSDKEAIIEQMKSISSQATGSAMPLEHTRMRGLDAFALNNSTLSGGVLSMYSLFDDEKGIVITADILNQEPERRKFQTIEDYHILRDRFLTRYAACVASHGG